MQRLRLGLEPVDIVDVLGLSEGSTYELQASAGRGQVARIATKSSRADIDNPAFYLSNLDMWEMRVTDMPVWAWTTNQDVSLTVGSPSEADVTPLDPKVAERIRLRTGRAAGTWTQDQWLPPLGTPTGMVVAADGDYYALDGRYSTVYRYPAGSQRMRPPGGDMQFIIARPWDVGSTHSAGSTHLRIRTPERDDEGNPNWTLPAGTTVTINGRVYKPTADTRSTVTSEGIWFVMLTVDRPATGTDFTEDNDAIISVPDYWHSPIALPAGITRPVGLVVKADKTIAVLDKVSRSIWERDPATKAWADAVSVRSAEGGQAEALALTRDDESYVLTGARSDTITRYDGTNWNKIADKPAGFMGGSSIAVDITGDILFNSKLVRRDIYLFDNTTWSVVKEGPFDRSAQSSNGVISVEPDGDIIFTNVGSQKLYRLVPG